MPLPVYRTIEKIIVNINSYEISKVISYLFSPHVDLDMGYWYIIWKGNTANIEVEYIVYTLYLRGWGLRAMSVFFFNIFSGDLYIDALIKGLF